MSLGITLRQEHPDGRSWRSDQLTRRVRRLTENVRPGRIRSGGTVGIARGHGDVVRDEGPSDWGTRVHAPALVISSIWID